MPILDKIQKELDDNLYFLERTLRIVRKNRVKFTKSRSCPAVSSTLDCLLITQSKIKRSIKVLEPLVIKLSDLEFTIAREKLKAEVVQQIEFRSRIKNIPVTSKRYRDLYLKLKDKNGIPKPLFEG